MSNFVYFIQSEADRSIKIGYSTNVAARLSYLATASAHPLKLLAVIAGDKRDEREIHWQFRKDHLHGEWFRSTERLLDFITALPEKIEVEKAARTQGADAFLSQALQWINRATGIFMSRDPSLCMGEARSRFADLAGLPPGTLENICRRRLSEISCKAYFGIRTALAELLREEADALAEQSDALSGADDLGPHEVLTKREGLR